MSENPDVTAVDRCPHWQRALPDAAAVCRRAADAAWTVSGRQPEAPEIAVVLSDDGEVQALNGRYRGQDRPTNVLSFRYAEAPSPGAAAEPLGDIVVAYETASEEARAHGRPLSDHVSRLVIHGMLHLLGFDHDGEADAAEMERLEARALAAAGIADPEAPLVIADHEPIDVR